MSFIPSGARVAIVACLVVVFVALALPVAQQPPTFRTGVEAVVMDVSVLDKDRRPVRGLTAGDFTVLEDGKPQDIRTFKAIDTEDVVETLPAPWVREVAPDIRRNDEFKDLPCRSDRHGQFDPDAGRRRPAGEEDGAGRSRPVQWEHGPHGVMDKNGIVRAVPFYQFNGDAMTLYQSTLSTLSGLARDLADLPERRKALILVSVGLPIDATLAAPDIAPSHTDQAGKTADLLRDLREALAAAQRANVSIYSLDPGGLRTVASPLNHDFLRTVSDTTGGFVVVDTNDPAPGIAQTTARIGRYLLLGYQSANGRTEGRVRKKGSTATTDHVEVLIHAYDMQARSRASERLNVRLATRPGLAEDVRYTVLSRLTLEPGRYQLRLAARSAGLGKSGSVYCDLDVPDVSKAALSLSGVMLEVTPSISAAPKGRLSSLIPIVPTVQRDFVADEQVGAFVRVYQGEKGGTGDETTGHHARAELCSGGMRRRRPVNADDQPANLVTTASGVQKSCVDLKCRLIASIQNTGPGCATGTAVVARLYDERNVQFGSDMPMMATTESLASKIIRPNDIVALESQGYVDATIILGATYRLVSTWTDVKCS